MSSFLVRGRTPSLILASCSFEMAQAFWEQSLKPPCGSLPPQTHPEAVTSGLQVFTLPPSWGTPRPPSYQSGPAPDLKSSHSYFQTQLPPFLLEPLFCVGLLGTRTHDGAGGGRIGAFNAGFPGRRPEQGWSPD